ncbi:MAG TPA: glycosyltransferase family 2 protein [Sphingobacteriaceae bacterium]
MKRKIIVLTPVKNEEWILETFLKTTSAFADHIILADQQSTDRTVEIAAAFPKVILIGNDSGTYDESSRQSLLINTARERFGTGHILLAIDADEIVSYDSLQSGDWAAIQAAAPGTVLFFEKPTFYRNTGQVIRYKSSGGWPLGFVDNGAEHHPSMIHSTRIPFRESYPRLYLKEIKFMHCNLLSMQRQRSKIRYYCLLEATARTRPWHRRIRHYYRHYDYLKEGDGLASAQSAWIDGWTRNGIRISRPESERFLWYDKECLKLFQAQGSRRYWMEDVWDINWNEAVRFFGTIDYRITPPPRIISYLRDSLCHTIRILSALKSAAGRLRTVPEN